MARFADFTDDELEDIVHALDVAITRDETADLSVAGRLEREAQSEQTRRLPADQLAELPE